MEPVPLWARVVGVLAGVLTAPMLVFAVLGGACSMMTVSAQAHRTWSYDVGQAPKLQVQVLYGSVVIEPGQDGQVLVQQDVTVESHTRAAAGDELRAASVEPSLLGGTLSVTQPGPALRPLTQSRDSTLTVRVPAHTDLDVTGATSVTARGLDGSVRIDGALQVDLRDATLRGDSRISVPTGTVAMHNVTVAGSTTVTKQLGETRFDGALAPGGSSLDIEVQTGAVTVSLPDPTDARATVTTHFGNLTADPVWHFTKPISYQERWVADLGPNPTGTVTVHTNVGGVRFNVR